MLDSASTIIIDQFQKSSRTPKWNKHKSFSWNYNSKVKQLLCSQQNLMASATLSYQSQCYSTSSGASENQSKKLTHVDGQGKATMVDVSAKDVTKREAVASATVEVGAEIAKLIAENNIKKGDVLTVAQIAGILAAKRTSELIPLCHNIALSSVKVQATLDQQRQAVQLQAKVCCSAQTGVEMESLTAVTIAALTVYDMCKAISHDIRITNVKLLKKTGGKSDYNHGKSNKSSA